MSWDANDVALLKELWAAGHSAGQIAGRLGHSRNAVSAKLKRLGHKRGHKPPTANPRIVAARKTAAACARPAERVVSRPKKAGRASAKPAAAPTRELTKRELYAMLASAVRNT